MAVAVVPMFSPITSAMPKYIGSTPVEQSRMVMAITAAELCTMQVMSVPMSTKAMMDQWLLTSNEEKKAMASGLCSRSSSFPAALSKTNEKNKKAMPKRKSPI